MELDRDEKFTLMVLQNPVKENEVIAGINLKAVF